MRKDEFVQTANHGGAFIAQRFISMLDKELTEYALSWWTGKVGDEGEELPSVINIMLHFDFLDNNIWLDLVKEEYSSFGSIKIMALGSGMSDKNRYRVFLRL